MQRQILATGFFLLSFMFPLKVTAQNYESISVFGDSFSDTGNVFNATAGAIPPSRPTLMDVFPMVQFGLNILHKNWG